MQMGRYQSESRYYLHIQLTGIEPPIWRKMVVPGAISLHTFHKMLQVVMGWEDAHLYLFRLTINEKTTVYGLPDPDWKDMRVRDSRRTKLDATVWADWLKLTYEYDLGDSWVHQITIEKMEHLADENLNEHALWITPRCLAGSRACPPVIWRKICQDFRGLIPGSPTPARHQPPHRLPGNARALRTCASTAPLRA